ncbi:ATP-binding cassette domain-containing protein [Ampullimonas aquatilis]|uniref:ATP-binding cassette domain-containing protein n=1 Tax=Ampullimonas aquatilis TaxID=1341549 RepID=UPI003C732EC5
MQDVMVSVQSLRKRYGTVDVVNGLNLSIRKGECYGLLGPNGAGKTTTLRLLLGLIEPDAGELLVNGQSILGHAREARMKIGVVPQMDTLDPDFTVAENLLVYGRYFGLSGKVLVGRIEELLQFASLESKRDAHIGELSGGMKRRLTLARALINNPDLILLDEPTTGLDPQARHLIWARLKALLANGKTILLTTHFMDEAERLCTRLAVMDQGKLIAEGVPHTLIAEYIEPVVVEVYGEEVRQFVEQCARNLAQRIELSGETAFCYLHEPAALLAQLVNWPQLRYLNRPANLEDLFLKLTGRDIRD